MRGYEGVCGEVADRQTNRQDRDCMHCLEAASNIHSQSNSDTAEKTKCELA